MRFFTGFVGFFVTVFILVSSISVCAEETLFFVSSESELMIALEQRDALKGLAVSVNFYHSATFENQEKLAELIRHIISLELRPVYLYGQPFDRELAQKLLMDEDSPTCTPTAFIGVFPRKDDQGSMCGANNNLTEVEFREWISFQWKNAQKLFLRDKNE